MKFDDIKLLCTFCNNNNIRNTIFDIKKYYFLVDKKIFVFTDIKDDSNVILSYNADMKRHNGEKLYNTISVHRKKQTNTIYTINAINKIIQEFNDGKLDENYKLDWNLYKNCLIVTHQTGYKITELKLNNIINI